MTPVTLEGFNGSTCDAQQYQQNLSSLTSPDHSIRHLTHGQSIGLALTAEASSISFVSVLVIFVLFIRNILRHRKARRKGGLKLLQAPAEIYMLSLFMFDAILATGGILNARWAYDGQVRTGFYCSAQGIIKQIGGFGTSLITLILAVQTLTAALWGIGGKSRDVAFGLVGLTCVYITLWVGTNNYIHKNYEAPAPYWCWISSRFEEERLVESICLWITLFTSVIVYIPLYLWAEGRLSIGDRWYKFHLFRPDQNVEYAKKRASLGMLFYPLAYSLVVLPLSITRWSHKHQHDIPSAALFFGQSTFNLSGAVNVLLFLIIRPQLLHFSPPENPAELEARMVFHRDMNTDPLPGIIQCELKPETKVAKLVEEQSRIFASEGSKELESEAPSRSNSMNDI